MGYSMQTRNHPKKFLRMCRALLLYLRLQVESPLLSSLITGKNPPAKPDDYDNQVYSIPVKMSLFRPLVFLPLGRFVGNSGRLMDWFERFYSWSVRDSGLRELCAESSQVPERRGSSLSVVASLIL